MQAASALMTQTSVVGATRLAGQTGLSVRLPENIPLVKVWMPRALTFSGQLGETSPVRGNDRQDLADGDRPGETGQTLAFLSFPETIFRRLHVDRRSIAQS